MTDEKIIQRIESGLKPIYAASDEELSLGINERNNTTEVYANAWDMVFSDWGERAEKFFRQGYGIPETERKFLMFYLWRNQ